jgi:hypothetical protein
MANGRVKIRTLAFPYVRKLFFIYTHAHNVLVDLNMYLRMYNANKLVKTRRTGKEKEERYCLGSGVRTSALPHGRTTWLVPLRIRLAVGKYQMRVPP